MPRKKNADFTAICLKQYDEARTLKSVYEKVNKETGEVHGVVAVFDELKSGKWAGNESCFVRINAQWHDFDQLRLLF